jgi:hypothetical protein
MLWEVETQSDGMKWRFETIQKAYDFKFEVEKHGEIASYPKFKG